MKVTAFLAGILTVAPVCGLRPSLAFLLETLNVPNPATGTLSPFFNALVITSNVASKARFASAFVNPVFAAIASTNSAFFHFILPPFFKQHMLTYTNYHTF